MSTRSQTANRGDARDALRPPRLLVVMDPIESIDPGKDSSFAMVLDAAASRAAERRLRGTTHAPAAPSNHDVVAGKHE